MRQPTAYIRDFNADAAYDSEAGYWAGLGEGEAPAATPWYETLIKTAIPALSTVYMQKQLTKINVARLNAGQSPLTAEEFSATYQPNAANVSVGPDRTATRLVIAGLTLGALYFGARLVMQGRRR